MASIRGGVETPGGEGLILPVPLAIVAIVALASSRLVI
jgi:hypothetical protein